MIARWLRILVALEVLLALMAAAAALNAGWPAWMAIGCALAVPPALHGPSIGIGSLAGAWHRRTTAPSHGLRVTSVRDGRWLALRVWAAETGASIRTLCWLMPFRGKEPLPSGTHTARLPIVLVHGYVCNRAIWRPLARVLAARGHPIAAPNLEPPFDSIDAFATQLERAVKELLASTGQQRVILIGHSLGGIVIRHWLREYGSQTASGVITLGSPHNGTWAARFGIGRAAKMLGASGTWLRGLALSESAALRERFEVILSLHDNVVMPQATQTLEGARNLAIGGLGHVELVLDAGVWTLVNDAVDRAQAREARAGEPGAPPPVEPSAAPA